MEEQVRLVSRGFKEGKHFFVFRKANYVFTVKQTEKTLVATAPIDVYTSALGKKWDLPGNWRQAYAAAYVKAGQELAKERLAAQPKKVLNQLTLF